MNRQGIWMLGLTILGLVVLTEFFSWVHQQETGSSSDSIAAEQELPSTDRFIVLVNWNNEAVFDRKTALVWERSATKRFANWEGAQKYCENLAVGNHKGWRLPTIQELISLVDPSVPSPGPTLPPGHPFSIKSTFYWSATTDFRDDAKAWGVGFDIGGVGSGGKTTIDYVWCVRDGEGIEMTPL
jgi:hypothetical protein